MKAEKEQRLLDIELDAFPVPQMIGQLEGSAKDGVSKQNPATDFRGDRRRASSLDGGGTR